MELCPIHNGRNACRRVLVRVVLLLESLERPCDAKRVDGSVI